jgi:hypothetical protein
MVWKMYEDDLLLSVLHKSYPGGRSERVRQWNEVAVMMNAEALERNLGGRIYTKRSVKVHYYRHVRQLFQRKAESAAVEYQNTAGATTSYTFLPPQRRKKSEIPAAKGLNVEPKGPPLYFEITEIRRARKGTDNAISTRIKGVRGLEWTGSSDFAERAC